MKGSGFTKSIQKGRSLTQESSKTSLPYDGRLRFSEEENTGDNGALDSDWDC